jgi:hypothetical protein
MNKTSSKKIVSTTTVAALIVLFAFAATCTPVSAAPEEDISEAIASGIACLAGLQNPDGSWGDSNKVASTGFAVLKFETHAIDHDQDPFDPSYQYSDEVITGLDYIFANAMTIEINMEHLVDDPDTNGNDIGVYFPGDWHDTYHTSIAMMAIAASEAPNRVVNVPSSPVDGWTYEDVVQDIVDYMAWGQTDTGSGQGGWDYTHQDDSGPRSDNSNTGYAVLGLDYAQIDMGCTVPGFVGSELNIWIDYIQNDANGGSGYDNPDSWVNILKTGNLLYEMSFCGDDENTPRAQDAIDYICRHWDDANSDPGWRAHYQAMYTTMKGLSAIYDMECDQFTICDIEWFDEMTTAIVDTQDDDGCWASDPWGGTILATEWALLTLQCVVPPPPVISVYVDIKPGSCPNPLNVKSKGVLPVAVLGTEDFDVTDIDPDTIELTLEGVEEGVSPLRWNYEDVATPFEGELCDCHELEGDGYMDLTLKFDTQELVGELDLCDFDDGDEIPLTITGYLYDGREIKGEDCIRVLEKGKE